jgi:chemotaxis methyl-accepting protein methylase
MNEGGYFFVGHSESLDRKAIGLAYIQPAVYKKVIS